MKLEPIRVPESKRPRMKTNLSPGKEAGALSVDWSAQLGNHTLLKIVLDAVQTVDAACLLKNEPQPPGYRPQMLLTLLTYCYASNVFGSRDIEAATDYDPTARYICAHTFPEWPAVRRFRRQHREWLEHCLTVVLKQAWAAKFEQGEAIHLGYLWFEWQFNQQINTEVRRRLELASIIDGAESD